MDRLAQVHLMHGYLNVHGRRQSGRHGAPRSGCHRSLSLHDRRGIISPATRGSSVDTVTSIANRRHSSRKAETLSVPMQMMEHDSMSGDEGGISDMLLPAIKKPHERHNNQRRLLRRSLALKELSGQMLVTLTYQKDVDKLSVTLVRAKSLPGKDAMTFSELFVQLLLFCDGRCVDQRKTVPRRSVPSPEFHESFTFAVPEQSELLTKVNLVVVFDHDSSGARKELGHAVLGPMGYAEGNGCRHWKDAVSMSPQRPTSLWHKMYRNKH